MDKAYSLYIQGELRAAIAELGEQLRRAPADVKARTFLFELLCFAGEFDRAEKQLAILATGSDSANIGATFLKDLLLAHRQRESLMEKTPQSDDGQLSAAPMRINGISYSACADAEDRVCGGLETYGSIGYKVIPWEEIERLEIQQPRRLRDLLWIPAELFSREADEEPKSIYLPALAPGSWRHADDNVRLGKTAVVEEDSAAHVVSFGPKFLLCDDDTISLLDVRTLETQQ